MGSTGHESVAHLAFQDLPPFPDDVLTAPLLRISLSKLLHDDVDEEDNLWRACCDLGFFYLDLRGGNAGNDIEGDHLLESANELFALANQIFDLPVDEKQKYDMVAEGSYFGYKGYGKGVIDKQGTRDRNEFWNVSKDDILGVTDRLANPPALSSDANREKIEAYMVRSHAVVTLILSRLNRRLGLPACALQDLHRIRARSGDQVRWVRSPPQPMDDARTALGEHTDFGSVTILFNRLGGLQVLPPGTEHWAYVRPLPGHCIVNLGDAMVKFTAGVLRSNIHRVVNPPGAQAEMTRYSLVYFARPEDDIILKNLQGSQAIDEARERSRKDGGAVEGDGEQVSAKEWILRRAMGRRTGGDWSRGEGTDKERLEKRDSKVHSS